MLCEEDMALGRVIILCKTSETVDVLLKLMSNDAIDTEEKGHIANSQRHKTNTRKLYTQHTKFSDCMDIVVKNVNRTNANTQVMSKRVLNARKETIS